MFWGIFKFVRMVIYLTSVSKYYKIERGRLQRHAERGREELPHVRGQGQKPGGLHAGGAAAERSYAATEDRGGGRECQAATAQEQGRRLGETTPHPRSGGCVGAGGPRGPIPHSRSGGVAVRRYPSSKVRETQVRR